MMIVDAATYTSGAPSNYSGKKRKFLSKTPCAIHTAPWYWQHRQFFFNVGKLFIRSVGVFFWGNWDGGKGFKENAKKYAKVTTNRLFVEEPGVCGKSRHQASVEMLHFVPSRVNCVCVRVCLKYDTI